MREILFRGKRTDNGEWVEGLLARYNPKFETANIVNEFELLVPVKTETVGQYTGLVDKNGAKVFEGDIMTFAAYGYTYVGVVEYVGSSFGIECKKASPFLDYAIVKYDATIIGNIYDNPELLGGADNGE